MQGLIYPLRLSGGNLETTKNYADLVRNAIFSGLQTQLDERVFRPEYGLDPQEFQAVSSVVTVLGIIRQTIVDALVGYQDVTFEAKASIADNGLMDVLVIYICPDEAPRTLEIQL